MKKRKIRSLSVSEIGMGCMGFSHGYGQIPAAGYAEEAIREAFDYGCNFFDTAEVYGKELYYPGHNEEIVGRAVKGFRNEVVIATKLFIKPEMVEDCGSVDAVVRKHLEHSLKNLQTSYVDLYYLHRINIAVDYLEVAHAMGRLIHEGLIREWGISAVDKVQLEMVNAITPVGAVQNIYSMVERTSEKEVIPFCVENGIAFVPFSPVASGLLSGKITPTTEFGRVDDVRVWVPQLKQENIIGNMPIVEMLKKFAAEKQATPAQVSLAWMLRKYPNVVPIPGSKNKGRIMENLRACEVQLTDEEFNKLESELDRLPVYGTRGHAETDQTSFGNNWLKKNRKE